MHRALGVWRVIARLRFWCIIHARIELANAYENLCCVFVGGENNSCGCSGGGVVGEVQYDGCVLLTAKRAPIKCLQLNGARFFEIINRGAVCQLADWHRYTIHTALCVSFAIWLILKLVYLFEMIL